MGEFKCSGTTGTSPGGTELVFAAGVHGLIQEDGTVSPNGGYGEGIIDGCTIVSLGFGAAGVLQNDTHVLSVSAAQDPGGIIPASTWSIGDGIMVTPTGGGPMSPRNRGRGSAWGFRQWQCQARP